MARHLKVDKPVAVVALDSETIRGRAAAGNGSDILSRRSGPGPPFWIFSPCAE